MEPCPADSTKRSRLIHDGLAGLCFMKRVHSSYAIGAAPIGMPGCPDFAFSIASIARVRMVAMDRSSIVLTFVDISFPPCLSSLRHCIIAGRVFQMPVRPCGPVAGWAPVRSGSGDGRLPLPEQARRRTAAAFGDCRFRSRIAAGQLPSAKKGPVPDQQSALTLPLL